MADIFYPNVHLFYSGGRCLMLVGKIYCLRFPEGFTQLKTIVMLENVSHDYSNPEQHSSLIFHAFSGLRYRCLSLEGSHKYQIAITSNIFYATSNLSRLITHVPFMGIWLIVNFCDHLIFGQGNFVDLIRKLYICSELPINVGILTTKSLIIHTYK